MLQAVDDVKIRARDYPMKPIGFYGIPVEKLGGGTFGNVYKYSGGEDGEKYAVKVFKDHGEEGVNHDTIRELTTLVRCDHPNIVKMIDFTMIKGKFAVVMGVYTSLSTYLGISRGDIPPNLIQSYSAQLLAGLEYLHDNSIAHRDLKPQNILLDKEGRIFIADLGSTRIGIIPGGRYTDLIVTIWWRAPEILLGSKYYDSYAVDVYSMGVIFAQFWLQNGPIFKKAKDEEDLLERQITTHGHFTEEDYPGLDKYRFFTAANRELANEKREGSMKESLMASQYAPQMGNMLDIILGMTTPNPDKRAKVKDIIANQYFDPIRGLIFNMNTTPNEACGRHLRNYNLPIKNQPFVNNDNTAALTPASYNVLYDWLREVVWEFRMSMSTLYHARYLIDHYLRVSTVAVERKNMQLLAVSALLISSKLLELSPVTVMDLVFITDNSYTSVEIKDMEKEILATVQFGLSYTLPMQYLHYVKSEVSDDIRKSALIIMNIIPALHGVTMDPMLDLFIGFYIALEKSPDPYPKCMMDMLPELDRESNIFIYALYASNKPKLVEFRTSAKYKDILDGFLNRGDVKKMNTTINNKPMRTIIQRPAPRIIQLPTNMTSMRTQTQSVEKLLKPAPMAPPYTVKFSIDQQGQFIQTSKEPLTEFILSFLGSLVIESIRRKRVSNNGVIDSARKSLAQYFKLSLLADGSYGPMTKIPSGVKFNIGVTGNTTIVTATFTLMAQSPMVLFRLFMDKLSTGKFLHVTRDVNGVIQILQN